MSEPKTRPTDVPVDDFLATVPDPKRRADAEVVLALMRKIARVEPCMWGPSIVGFGSRPIRYADGKELDWPVLGFSPRKQDLTVYFMSGFEHRTDELARLGKHRTGKSCLYLKRLSDVDARVLEEMIRSEWKRKP